MLITLAALGKGLDRICRFVSLKASVPAISDTRRKQVFSMTGDQQQAGFKPSVGAQGRRC